MSPKRAPPAWHRLDVLPREVANAVRGDGATDAGVGSVVIVLMEPVPVGRSTGLVAGVGPGIGPFGREGAVEALDLPFVWGRYGRVRRCLAFPSALAKSCER